ncbi:sugar transferase [Curtobacterium herbarum]|uniref:Sugar transferase n=1 Tax=Curtobacterium herbarum TaxID=150122 RepID=A0ABP4K5L9_9MICO|nr:sugar transferase [Curtobacterium herbarum]MBM7476619.1 lipopolysaccharide/colanic/teichoic acid biosynthesis glycosyltransferase [Curtobacterium herbarum]MCS6543819.1 sugar transferase [Curtobacterium herbarum]
MIDNDVPNRWARPKRVCDVVTAVVLLVVSAPLMLLVAVLIRCEGSGPVLYRQLRPGLHGEPFQIVKFRSMRPDPELERLGTDGDHVRITRLGRILRASSVDELPNLVNVLRGEMSIIGPRPLLMSYLDLYSAHQARRHEVRPGMTGLAQVNGRNDTDWTTRFDLDVEYVERCSLRLDVQILVATVWTVVSRRGVSARGHATMVTFRGDDTESFATR